MGVLDSLVGGDVSAEFVRVVEGFIQKQGGVAGLVKQFDKQGLGPIIQSWVEKAQTTPFRPGRSTAHWGMRRCSSWARNSASRQTKWPRSCQRFFRKQSRRSRPKGAVQHLDGGGDNAGFDEVNVVGGA